MFTKRAFWGAAAMLMVGMGTAHAGCTSLYDEAYKPVEATGGEGGTTTSNCTSECCTPEDCPDPGNACITRTCTNGNCGTENAPDGTKIDDATPDDCKLDACDGNGGTKQRLKKQGETCNENGGKTCNATGKCVECNADSDDDCKAPEPLCIDEQCAPETCVDHAKNGTETDEDCGGGCPACADGKHCSVNGDCQSVVCKSTTCQVPTCDDQTKNGGEGDVDCGEVCPGKKCGPGKGCNVDTDCVGQDCTSMNGTCKPNCFDKTQNNQEVGVDCGGGGANACPGCPVGGPCAGSDANCVTGAYCANDVCIAKKTAGTACTIDNECAAGVCEPTDHVCCDQACSGMCRSCKLAGSEGTCGDVPAGTDPEMECADLTVCNGKGGCGAPTGTACSNAAECGTGFCADGVCCGGACIGTCFACNLGAPGACVVVPNGMEDPGACDGSSEACGDVGSGCADTGGKKKFGEACDAGGQCVNNLCRGASCKLAVGAPCTDATKDNCVTYRCANNQCAACVGNADCPGTSCNMPNCTYPTGHPCKVSGECSSGSCLLGTCQ